MAKKQAARKAYHAGPERITVAAVKGSLAYREWLNDVSGESRIAATVIIRDALAEWARKRGYPDPPEI